MRRVLAAELPSSSTDDGSIAVESQVAVDRKLALAWTVEVV
jgi:hypothetical protein